MHAAYNTLLALKYWVQAICQFGFQRDSMDDKFKVQHKNIQRYANNYLIV